MRFDDQPVPPELAARFEALRELAQQTPGREPERAPASPRGVYRKPPRQCTVCGSREIVCDGMYLCREHHP